MKAQIIFTLALILFVQSTHTMAIESLDSGEQLLHFGFKTENGQSRTEDIKYKTNKNGIAAEKGQESKEDAGTTVMPVEYRGGYSFISADGYEYTVLYKANKNGFQPYVTAHKIRDDKI